MRCSSAPTSSLRSAGSSSPPPLLSTPLIDRAHARFASSIALNSSARATISAARADTSRGPSQPATAKAQTRLAWFCALKLRSGLRSTSVQIARKSGRAAVRERASDQAILARGCGSS